MKKSLIFLSLLLLACLLCACGGVHTDHTLTCHEAVSATCGAAGSVRYWQCTTCGKAFSNERATDEIVDMSTVAVAPTGQHHYDGTNVCVDCGLTLVEHEQAPFSLNEDGASYTFTGTATAAQVTVPSHYEGKPVTAISAGAFRQNKTLQNVVLPDTVTRIGAEAFVNCTALTDVTLGTGLTAIGEAAFGGCAALVRVHVPDIATWLAIDFDGSGASPFSYAKELYINGAPVTAITVPDGVTQIKPYTFYNLQSMTAITLPDSVTRIGDSAFYACSRLTAITLPAGLAEIGTNAFYFCRSLTEISLPAGLSRIGAGAFFRCTALTSVSFAEATGWACGETALHAVDLAVPVTASVYLTTLHTEEPWQRTVS